MEEKTITRIPPMPFALMWGAISAIIGLIAGIIAAIFWASLFSWITTIPNYTGPPLSAFGIIFGIGAVFIFPIAWFIVGLIQSLIFAALYNFLAPRIGGIRLHLKTETRPLPQQ
jgi:hypothetical protein